MNEYEHFKKWVNSFGVKIYYKLKPPTKKELYEIATRQEEEIERLNKILEDINYYIEQRIKENITDEVRIELRIIELIANGTIKVVK